jgi:hypothetical protein
VASLMHTPATITAHASTVSVKVEGLSAMIKYQQNFAMSVIRCLAREQREGGLTSGRDQRTFFIGYLKRF